MIVLTLKKKTLTKFICLLLSAGYAYFVLASAQRLHYYGNGDLHSYVHYFDGNNLSLLLSQLNHIHGDHFFRAGFFILKEYLNVESITLLFCIVVLISFNIFYIFLVNLKQGKYLFYLLPILLMIFFTPTVTNLFASLIRSSIAFSILFIAIVYFKGVTKYILFGLSSLMHLSMAPIIFLYILFHMLNRIKTGLHFIVALFVLLLYSLSIVLFSSIYKFNTIPVSQSIAFNLLILFIGLLMIFNDKKAIKNIYGFISIGLILIHFCGVFLDVSFFRYVGYSLIFYLFFLIDKGGGRSIQSFTVGYFLFFLVTSYFAIVNVLN